MQNISSVLNSEKTLGLLDYHLIREQVARHTGFPLARKMAMELTPSFSAATVKQLQDETTEGIFLLDNGRDLDLYSPEDPSDIVERAALNGMLTGLELQRIASSLDLLQYARAKLSASHESIPTLSTLAHGIPDLRKLHADIKTTIGPRGEVVDTATPILGPLRQDVRKAYHRVSGTLKRIVQSSVGREALQDQVISIRSNRLVIQVKTEQRHLVPGIVHDSSNSGASLFVEPFTTTDLCNSWRELSLKEERETVRVLRILSELVGTAASSIILGLDITAQIDFILAKARYSVSLQGSAATISANDFDNHTSERPPTLQLIKARHPLLGQDAVPVTLHIGPDWRVLVITGPNMGGKTVTMKTIGILSLMHQSGLHIPAQEGSILPIFDGIFADIGDQQSIERSVSAFSSHISNVTNILCQATKNSLVLMDEVGTSTDPEEGSALASAILDHLDKRKITSVATTHYKSVASYAKGSAGMMNASMELDPTTLQPTYHLNLGIPGRSYALSVADHMGLPAEIIEKAKSMMDPQYLKFDNWLSELQDERTQLQQRLLEAEEAQTRAKSTKRELDAQLDDFKFRRAETQNKMHSDLLQTFEDIRKKLLKAESSLSWQISAESVTQARQVIKDAKADLRQIVNSPTSESARHKDNPLEVGNLVDCHGFGVRGTVVSVPEQGDEIEVAIGKVNIRLSASRLSRIDNSEDPEVFSGTVQYDLGPSLTSLDLDLRGRRTEEALIEVEQFLDKALRDGISSIRIIHGKGTGALRSAIRELLEEHAMIKSFFPEVPDKGGDGVTLVELM